MKVVVDLPVARRVHGIVLVHVDVAVAAGPVGTGSGKRRADGKVERARGGNLGLGRAGGEREGNRGRHQKREAAFHEQFLS